MARCTQHPLSPAQPLQISIRHNRLIERPPPILEKALIDLPRAFLRWILARDSDAAVFHIVDKPHQRTLCPVARMFRPDIRGQTVHFDQSVPDRGPWEDVDSRVVRCCQLGVGWHEIGRKHENPTRAVCCLEDTLGSQPGEEEMAGIHSTGVFVGRS